MTSTTKISHLLIKTVFWSLIHRINPFEKFAGVNKALQQRSVRAAKGFIMTRGFLPNTDSGLMAWSANFGSAISAMPEVYGISAGQAAAFMAVQSAFAASMAASEPTVLSRLTTSAKNAVRDVLKLSARQMASIIQGQSTVTDEQ